MKNIIIFCLFPFIATSQIRELNIEFEYPRINVDSLVLVDNDVIIMSKKIIDTNITLYPIFLNENGLLNFISGKVVDSFYINKRLNFSFDLYIDTSISAIALQHISINFYKENSFSIENQPLKLHNDIYFDQYLKSLPVYTKNININNYGHWNTYCFTIDSENIGQYFNIGISKLNGKELMELIRNFSLNKNEEILTPVLMKCLRKKIKNGVNFFSPNETNTIDFITPKMLFKNIIIREV